MCIYILGDPVKTTELNTRPASQVELEADIQTTDDSPRDITVDMIDDQKYGQDDVVSPLVIKQEPEDETYGVPEPTLLPLISRQDIVYNDDQGIPHYSHIILNVITNLKYRLVKIAGHHHLFSTDLDNHD
ncbi:hypothetical protein SNE40_005999 [Patella caerulea]|uniref:Uncharacterized protein n=1 Tax=Patella caerulea TaxID=87958 RepID=A0AAN8PZD6_PATCE